MTVCSIRSARRRPKPDGAKFVKSGTGRLNIMLRTGTGTSISVFLLVVIRGSGVIRGSRGVTVAAATPGAAGSSREQTDLQGAAGGKKAP